MEKVDAVNIGKKLLQAYINNDTETIKSIVHPSKTMENSDDILVINNLIFGSEFWISAFSNLSITYHKFLWDKSISTLFISFSFTGVQSGWLGDNAPTDEEITQKAHWLLTIENSLVTGFIPFFSFVEILSELGHIEAKKPADKLVSSYMRKLSQIGIFDKNK